MCAEADSNGLQGVLTRHLVRVEGGICGIKRSQVGR